MLAVTTIFQAVRQLGFAPVLLNALYRIGLHSGYYARLTRQPSQLAVAKPHAWELQGVLALPAVQAIQANVDRRSQEALICEADEIVAGQVRLFGGQPQPLNLAPPGDLQHWTAYELDKAQVQAPHDDIKFVWEPCRFGWAAILGRAYYLTQDERYPEAFWKYFETFTQHNPAYQGPNWVSAQEVALRLITMTFAWQLLATSEHSTLQRRQELGRMIALHAQRIPPTLVYARAQNNNHLLSEAAGLFTAALVLPHHPQALRWRKLGWHWFQRGIQKQVTPEGVFMQHSVNYHRLMLQLALWMDALCRQQGLELPKNTRERLAAATHWLMALVDPVSGRTPNLGANDGAYILPLSAQPFEDYRPVVQAAGAAFLKRLPVQAGAWDEMRLWFGLSAREKTGAQEDSYGHTALQSKIGILRHPNNPASWAYLRLAAFQDRPGHADLLHVDLWHQGENLALDAGAYLYNAPPPWDNAFTRTQVHNTVLVDHQEQMRRVGRFLYLDWVDTQLLSCEQDEQGYLASLSAQHEGYARLGVIHRRSLSAKDNGAWLVEDHLLEQATGRKSGALHSLCLHWLLPDYPWSLDSQENGVDLNMEARSGRIKLRLSAQSAPSPAASLQVQVVRAGELLFGQGSVEPTWGWSSPHYGDKIPALSIRLSVESQLPAILTSYWHFSEA